MSDAVEVTKGQASKLAPSVQVLLDREKRPVPPALRRESFVQLGNEDISIDRYVSPEFHRLEVEKLWSRVWQMVCREEDIPNVGDHVVYDIADYSLLVVRSGENEFKALYNTCLHRGTQLRSNGGCSKSFRCPFHGWTWNLDGTLKSIPAKWDFKHVDESRFSLPEVKLGTWGGFIFVNFDDECEPLDSYLGGLKEHFKDWPLEDRYKAVHVAKTIRANWKATQEAFLESYHVIATHPQGLWSIGDLNTEYDLYPGQAHFNRMITPMAVPSPHLGDDVDQESVLAGRKAGRIQGETPPIPPGATAREHAAELQRTVLKQMTGVDLSERTDSEMVDAIQYFVFPNMVPWAGYGSPIIYRFRPNGNDPDSSIMEVMMLRPFDKSKGRPEPAKVHWLGVDEDWLNAPELGEMLCIIFNQDTANLEKVQRGMKAMKSRKPGVTLGTYQESRIRHFHHTLGEYLSR